MPFVDMVKAYDQLNIDQLFEIMNGYGVLESLEGLIERIYDDRMVKFELDNITTGLRKIDSGVKHGCSLSPLPLNIYMSGN